MEERSVWRNRFLCVCLTLFFVTPILVPFASADGMDICDFGDSKCDDYDGDDDGTPTQQEWIRGTYDFDLHDTTTIHINMDWAIREFNRTKLGLTGAPYDAALLSEGLEEHDGIPADMIRSYLDLDLDGSGTIGEKMLGDVEDTIRELLTNGFGTVEMIDTDYSTTFTEEGTSVTCTKEGSDDSIHDSGSTTTENNVFEPPICLNTFAIIKLSTSTFNLLDNTNLDLERAYQGLLIMGSELTTEFSVFADPGHYSTFVISPPDYAAVLDVGGENGNKVPIACTPATCVGRWTVNNLVPEDGREEQTVSLTMGHRNTSTTSVVELDPSKEAVSLHLKVDLFDEQAVQIDFIAGISYLDSTTMENWGISLVELSSLATIPQITSDGIRLAYENGIAPLDDFTDQFPVASIGNAFSDSIPGGPNIEMGELSWVSDSVAEGIEGPAGGLNYSHSVGCSETVVPPNTISYCIEGSSAMGYAHPIYLRSTSNTFSLGLLDIIQDNLPENQFSEYFEDITNEDLRRVMDAGLSLETVLDTSFLESMIPSDLPPSKITLELILPNWVETIDGEDRIVLQHSVTGENRNEVSIAGPSPYTYNHPILNENDEVICLQTQKTCVSTSLEIDFETFDINEWTKSVSIEFGLEASAVVHRVALPQGYYDINDDTTVRMEVIPSDLVRLIGDIMSRSDSPMKIERCLEPDTEFENCPEARQLVFELTSDGLMEFGTEVGEILTNEIHTAAEELENIKENPQFSDVDISDFSIETSLAGLGTPGPVVSDDVGLSVTVKIPKVRFTLAVSSSWGDLFSGDPDLITLSLLTEDINSAFRSPFLQPMVLMVDEVSSIFATSLVSSEGVTFPPLEEEALTFQTGSWDTTIHEDTEFDLTGPVSFTLPKGIVVKEGTSQQGNMEITEDGDGRQVITYTIPPDGLDDEVTLRLQVTWMYLLGQFWAYPAVVVILLILLIRRRRKKKKKKRAAREAKHSLYKAQKMGLSESDFAQMAGLVDRQVGGYDEGINPFEAMSKEPPR
ncbi:MAG: hypothetical protein CMA67_03510 [Euryarchaeota archaeon]|nr:hypothetical protein [Euryarchaeota archaeon]